MSRFFISYFYSITFLRYLFCAVLIFFSPQSLAQMDLKAAYQKALFVDVDFQVQKENLLSSQQKAGISRAGLLPSLSVQSDTGIINQNISSESSEIFDSGSSRFHEKGYTATLKQTLFNMPAWHTMKKGKLEVSLAELLFEEAKLQLIMDVTTHYFSVLEAKNKLTLAKSELESLQEHVNSMQASLKEGLVSTSELYEAQARFSRSEAKLLKIQNEHKITSLQLSMMTGNEGNIIGLSKDPSIPNIASLERIKSSAQHNDIKIHQQQIKIELAKRELKSKRASHLPTLEAVGERRYRDSGGSIFGDGSVNRRRSMTLQLNIPLLNGGETFYQTRSARHDLRAARSLKESYIRKATFTAEKAYLNLQSIHNERTALNKNIKAANLTLNAKKAGLDLGLFSNSEVLDAQTELYKVKEEYQAAKYQHILAWLELRRASGTLSHIDIDNINVWWLQ